MNELKSEVSEEMKRSAELLTDEVVRFVTRVDSLRSLLPVEALILAANAKASTDKFVKHLETKGELLSKPGEPPVYSLSGRENQIAARLQRQMNMGTEARLIVPRHFLIGMVSEFDFFLGRLVRQLYQAKPETLNAASKQIAFSEMMSLGSIDAVAEYFIDKEIDVLLRKSHVEQIEWLEKTFNVELKSKVTCWPAFVEVCERRNLYVHCDGRISSQYLRVCAEHKVVGEEKTIGSILGASRGYLNASADTLLQTGVLLSQILWRKIIPSTAILADAALTVATYELLVDKRFKLAGDILQSVIDKTIRPASDITRRTIVINRAQAHKFSGSQADCEKLLKQEDWSACRREFSLCVHVLRDQFDDAAKAMMEIGASGTPARDDYISWPIFHIFRESEQFKTAFQSVFGEDTSSIAAPPADSSDPISQLMKRLTGE